MRVTQKDIARQLNLSQALVAGVLGDKPGVWVSAANRERIQQTAREMNYRPNAAARRLQSGKSDSVAFVVSHPAENLSLELGGIVAGLTLFLEPRGQDLTVKAFPQAQQALDGLTEMARTRTCDAVVLLGPSAEVEHQAALLESLHLPFVVIGCLENPHPEWPQIDFDHLEMMRRSVAHLTALGHKRIAYLGHGNREQYSARLEAGFRSAMRELAGDTAPENRMCRLQPVQGHGTDVWIGSLLALPPPDRPTAIVLGASDDVTWRELELALAQAGLRLGEGPGEFAATGVRHTNSPLLFGKAQGFSQTDFGHLMNTLCTSLLSPLLAGAAPTEFILRICPPMQDMESCDLLNYVRLHSETNSSKVFDLMAA
ncbi:MAG: LacI family DNA-binding transcriptional regulator [Janthinobacterium lividum]